MDGKTVAAKSKGLVGEFREFIARGNVIDMAVGVIMGSSFTAIVNSLVKEVLMPAIGFLVGGVDFSQLKWVLSPATEAAEEVAVLYGSFLNQVINFLIVAFVVFLMVKMINRFHRKEEAPPAPPKAPEPSEEVKALLEIRDLLKEGRSLSND